MESIGEQNLSNKTDIKRLILNFKDKKEDLDYIKQLLKKVNEKEIGEEVTPYDLVMMGLKSINEKGIEKLKENSITPRQRMLRAYKEAQINDNYKGSLDEFMCSRAKI